MKRITAKWDQAKSAHRNFHNPKERKDTEANVQGALKRLRVMLMAEGSRRGRFKANCRGALKFAGA